MCRNPQTAESPTIANASYTLYWVTLETRASREQRIREIFAKEPAWGYLMAAFDFEWTIRRAIILMSICPTALVKKSLEIGHVSSLGSYHKCWCKYVKRVLGDSIPDLIDIVFDDPNVALTTKDKIRLLEDAMQLRHRLVHGVSGSIPAKLAKDFFETLLTASKKISAYVDTHAEKHMNERVIRRQERCDKCEKKRKCPLRGKERFQCSRKQECPFVRKA